MILELFTLILYFNIINCELTCSYSDTFITTGIGLELNIVPDCNEKIISSEIVPVLPDGVKLAVTGVINGATSFSFSAVTFIVSLSSEDETTTSSFTLECIFMVLYIYIAIGKITSCSYGLADKSILNGFEDIQFNLESPECMSSASSFDINPELPLGLVFNRHTGSIKGKPKKTIEKTIYTITASNAISSYKISITIIINVKTKDAFPSGIEYRLSNTVNYISDTSMKDMWNKFDNNMFITYLPGLEYTISDNDYLLDSYYAGRLNGCIYIKKTGRYTFYFESVDGMQFFFGNSDSDDTIFEDFKAFTSSSGVEQEYTPPFDLEKGKFYEFGAIFFRKLYNLGFMLKIQWSYQGLEKVSIPSDQLYHIPSLVQFLEYDSVFTTIVNKQFNFQYISLTGSAEEWSIKPDLPDGVIFKDGVIKGSYTNNYPTTIYTVTASTAMSSSSFIFTMTIIGSDANQYMNGILVNYYKRDRIECNDEDDKYPSEHPDIYTKMVSRYENILEYPFVKEPYDGLPAYMNDYYNVEWSTDVEIELDGDYEFDVVTNGKNWFYLYSESKINSPDFKHPDSVTKDDVTTTSLRVYLMASRIPLYASSCTVKSDKIGGGIHLAGGPDQLERQPIPVSMMKYTPTKQFYYTYPFIKYVSMATITNNEPIFFLLSSDDFNDFSVQPSLPYGLSIDSDNGIISGTPYVNEMDIQTYTITGYEKSTKTEIKTTIEIGIVQMTGPSNLEYYDSITGKTVSSLTYVVNTEINPLKPRIINDISIRYYTKPDLPSGISIDKYSGIISGKAKDTYGAIVVVYGDRKGLTTTYTLSIIVNACGVNLQYFEINWYIIDKEFSYIITHNNEILYESEEFISNSVSQFSYCGTSDEYFIHIISNVQNGPSYSIYVGSTLVDYNKIDSGKQNIFISFTNKITLLPSLYYPTDNIIEMYYDLLSTHYGHIIGGIYSASISPPLPDGLSFNSTTMIISGVASNIGKSYHSITLTNPKGSANIAITINVITCPEGKTAFYIYFYGNDKASEAEITFTRHSDNHILFNYNGNLEQYKRTTLYYCEPSNTYTLTLGSTMGTTWDGATSLSIFTEGHIEILFKKYRTTVDSTYEVDLDFKVTASSIWKYYYSSERNPGTNWKKSNYYDGHWSESSAVNYQKRYGITSYYRKVITIDGYLDDYSSFQAAFKFDGGIVAYINENEFFRYNMPAGEIDYNTKPLKMLNNDEITYKRVSGPIQYIKLGENILTVELHIFNDSSVSKINPFAAWFDTVNSEGSKHCSLRTTQRSHFSNQYINYWLTENPGSLVDGDPDTIYANSPSKSWTDVEFSGYRYEYINSIFIRANRWDQPQRCPVSFTISGYNEITNSYDTILDVENEDLYNTNYEHHYYLTDPPEISYSTFRIYINKITGGYAEDMFEIRDLLFYTCNLQGCPAEGDWPKTAVGGSASKKCPEGKSGNLVRKCQEVDGHIQWGPIPNEDEICQNTGLWIQFDEIIYYPNEELINEIVHPGVTCQSIYLVDNVLSFLTLQVNDDVYIVTGSITNPSSIIEADYIIKIKGSCKFENQTSVEFNPSFKLSIKSMPIKNYPIKFYKLSLPTDPIPSSANNMLIRYEEVNFDSIDHYHSWEGLPYPYIKNYAIKSEGFMQFDVTGKWILTIKFQGYLKVEFDGKNIINGDTSDDEVKEFTTQFTTYRKNILKSLNMEYIGKEGNRNILQVYTQSPQSNELTIHKLYYCKESRNFVYTGELYSAEVNSLSLSILPITKYNEGFIYTISPSLPIGINFDSTNGEISGTPITSQAGTTYTVTVIYMDGTIETTTLKYEILDTISNTLTLKIKDCNDNDVSEFIFIRNSYLICEGYKIVGDQPMSYNTAPLYEDLTFNTTTGVLNYYNDYNVEYPIIVSGETLYGAINIETTIKVIDCSGTLYTVILESYKDSIGEYVIYKGNNNIYSTTIIEPYTKYHFGICATSSDNLYKLTFKLLSESTIRYTLLTYNNILLIDTNYTIDSSGNEILTKDEDIYFERSFTYSYSTEKPQVTHPSIIEYVPYKLTVISPNITTIVSYSIKNSHPLGISINSNGVISILLTICTDYIIEIVAENNMDSTSYNILLRCISGCNSNSFKLLSSRTVGIGASNEIYTIYNYKTNDILYSSVSTYLNEKYTENITYCYDDDILIKMEDNDSDSWASGSNIIIYTPFEMVLSQSLYDIHRYDNNSFKISKPILFTDTKWKINYNIQPTDLTWSSLNYDDSSWIEDSYPNWNIPNTNPLRIAMRKKLFINEQVSSICIDFIYNDSFSLVVNGKLVNLYNARNFNGNLIQTLTQHETYHNSTVITTDYLLPGKDNIFSVYYWKSTDYSPLIQFVFYPTYIDEILNYPSNSEILDLNEDTSIQYSCSKNLEIPFTFLHQVIFNSYKIVSSIITKDIRWSLYALTSDDRSVLLSQSIGKFNDIFVITKIYPSSTFYLLIEDCNYIRSFVIKDIIITFSNIKYCQSEGEYFAVGINQYSISSCKQPWEGNIKKKCILNTADNTAKWSNEEDDSNCDYSSPNQLSLENNIELIEGYLNVDIGSYKINNYNSKYYQGVYNVPDLPNGMVFDKENGIISGVPTESIDNQTYSILVYNKNGRKYLLFNMNIYSLISEFTYPEVYSLTNTPLEISPYQKIDAKNIYVYPDLPNELSIDENGIIRGVLTNPNDITTYYITYENPVGERSAKLFLVVSGKPTIYDYENNPFEISQSIYFNSGLPIISGLIDSYSCESLPSGLVIDEKTGIISGNPTIIKNSTHICTAKNIIGTKDTIIKFNVLERKCQLEIDNEIWIGEPGVWLENNQMCKTGTSGFYLRYCSNETIPEWTTLLDICDADIPTSLRYPKSIIYYYKQKGETFSPSATGIINQYEISPELPDGLYFNTTNGDISGSPNVLIIDNIYTVTGKNEKGSISTTISITVRGRYCEEDEEWPITLIDESVVLSCGNGMNGLIIRHCYGNNDEEWWSNSSEHCLSQNINQYDTFYDYFYGSISFYNVTFNNESLIDYLVIEYLENESNIFPIAFVDKEFIETDRFSRLYTVTYTIQYKIDTNIYKTYNDSVQCLLDSSSFKDDLSTKIDIKLNSLKYKINHLPHLKHKKWSDNGGLVFLVVLAVLICVAVIILCITTYILRRKGIKIENYIPFISKLSKINVSGDLNENTVSITHSKSIVVEGLLHKDSKMKSQSNFSSGLIRKPPSFSSRSILSGGSNKQNDSKYGLFSPNIANGRSVLLSPNAGNMTLSHILSPTTNSRKIKAQIPNNNSQPYKLELLTEKKKLKNSLESDKDSMNSDRKSSVRLAPLNHKPSVDPLNSPIILTTHVASANPLLKSSNAGTTGVFKSTGANSSILKPSYIGILHSSANISNSPDASKNESLRVSRNLNDLNNHDFDIGPPAIEDNNNNNNVVNSCEINRESNTTPSIIGSSPLKKVIRVDDIINSEKEKENDNKLKTEFNENIVKNEETESDKTIKEERNDNTKSDESTEKETKSVETEEQRNSDETKIDGRKSDQSTEKEKDENLKEEEIHTPKSDESPKEKDENSDELNTDKTADKEDEVKVTSEQAVN